MARLNLAPVVLIAAFAGLALLGARGQAYNTMPLVTCAYRLGDIDALAADVLFIGSSRMGRALDVGYMERRVTASIGKDIVIERLGLTLPRLPQYRPLVRHYINGRGAPHYVFLQLLYNFEPDRQRSWDTPINSPRNVAFATMGELVEIQNSAEMNDFDTLLPRWTEAAYVTTPAVILQDISTDIYAGMRYPSQKLEGRLDRCSGDQIYRQSAQWQHNTLTDDIVFEEGADQKQRRVENEKKMADYLPISANSPLRRYENSQYRPLLKELSEAGSTVFITILPSLGQRSVSDQEIADLARAFPGYQVVDPFDIYKGPLGDQLSVSFRDTHHFTDFGALHITRYFADYISGLDL